MQNLINKHRLKIVKGPLPVSYDEPFSSLDEILKQQPFHMHHVPRTSYDAMFPLDTPLPKKFDLYLLDHPQDIFWTHNFLDDVKADSSLFLVGIHGIILLGLQHYSEISKIENGKCSLSPAYHFGERRALSGKEDEPQIPYFYKNDAGSIGIAYSRTAAASLPGNEPILIGKISQ